MNLEEDENRILQKLEPQMTNATGQIVVEVEKVLKDLQVLYKSMKASKFFKLCISQDSESALPPDSLFDPSSDEQQVS